MMEPADSYRPNPMCRICKRDSYTEAASTHCCDCGISLCKTCSKGKCGSKDHHRTVDLKGMGQEEITGLYSFCSKCKKGKEKYVLAARHCNDCGKSYCDRCSQIHEEKRKTTWHELMDVDKLFVKVPNSRGRLASAPPESELDFTENVQPVIPEAHEPKVRSQKMDKSEIMLYYNVQEIRLYYNFQCQKMYHGENTARFPQSMPINIPGRPRKDPAMRYSSVASSASPTSSDCNTDLDDSPPPYTDEDYLYWCQFNSRPPSYCL